MEELTQEHDWTQVDDHGVECLKCHRTDILGAVGGSGCEGYWCTECCETYVSPCQRHDARAQKPKQIGGTHYQLGDHEPFDVFDEWGKTWKHGAQFYLASALKYVARLGRKGDDAAAAQDLDKAIHYLTEARRRFYS